MDGSRKVWDLARYDFLEGADSPDTVHPSLWRQARLNRMAGLFEVVPGLYQVRGFDLSNMTLIEGETGVIVVDPLVSVDAAAAALALYRRLRGDRPVTGIVYTHSHSDHYGGGRGVVDDETVRRIPIVAPQGFVREVIGETLFAGHAMFRRAVYFSGAMLDRGPRGHVDAGLGKSVSTGTVSLVPPNDEIRETGETRVIDGVEFIFQMAPETEAPVEMLFFLPRYSALCAAELATRTMHNVYTPRGAQVRSAMAWWKALQEAIDLFGERTDVLFAQHHWPCWGRDSVRALLSRQRDLYKFLHDQTLRLMNLGLGPDDIAARLNLPPELAKAWDCREYYGTLSHNVKGIYQRYLGWYDSHPAGLDPHPPVEAARRYVDFMGGADETVRKARASFEAGDYRWVAEVLRHVVFAEPDHREARLLQADALEQLGYQSEAATWRNEYLSAAHELRHGILTWPARKTGNPDQLRAMSSEMLLDYLGIRLNAERAEGIALTMEVTLIDTDERFFLSLSNSALTYSRTGDEAADVALSLSRPRFEAFALGSGSLDPSALTRGDGALIPLFCTMFDAFTGDFPIIEP